MTWQGILTVILLTGRLSESVYESLTFCILGGYFLSNVASKAVDKDATRKDKEG